jgi:predicted transposase YdaD
MYLYLCRRDTILYQLFRQSPTLLFELISQPPLDADRESRAIINLVSTIVLYKFGTLIRDEVDMMLGIELQQTQVYQDAQLEEGERLVLKLLIRKLGNINPEIRSRVNSLTIEQLESLGEDLLDFTQMSDILAWLDTH